VEHLCDRFERRKTSAANFWPSDKQMPSWSRDGKWIYFTWDRTGREEIWRMSHTGGSPEQVTSDGGKTAFESADGKTLLYTKDDSSPLFAKPPAGGPERQVLEWVTSNAFAPVERGIYYIGRRGTDRKYPLDFYEFSSKTSRELTRIEGYATLGLSVSPDRQTIIFPKSVSNGSNLMMIEDFQ
jgi:WD40-like Beta Propeller Repeat